MSRHAYAGVGSRETPLEIRQFMTKVAGRLERHGYVLRSGGAKGADKAFEAGVRNLKNKDIFLPNPGAMPIPFQTWDEAITIANQIHPAWKNCNAYARLCHARNVFQVLGNNLNDPSRFVICWTKGGQLIGGTRTAIVLAEDRGIPIYNLALEDHYRKVLDLLEHLQEMHRMEKCL